MKVKILILVFVLSFFADSVLLAGGEEGSRSRIQIKYLSGRKYFHKGDYATAIKQFEEVIKIDPNYKIAAEYLKAAKAKLQAQSQQEAALQDKIKMLKEVAEEKEQRKIKSEEGFKTAWQRWLAKEEEKRRVKEEKKRIALEKKREMARLKREKELAHYYGLNELEKISQNAQGMITEAEKKKTLQEEKENKKWNKVESLPSPKKEKTMAMIYMSRANTAYKEGNYDEAIKEWEKVTALDPANRAAQKRIEAVRRMIEENKQDELEKARRESIAQAKVAAVKYYKRGNYLYGHKDYKASAEEFQKAIAIDPSSKAAQKGLLKAGKKLRAKSLKEEKGRQKIAYKVSNLVSKGNGYLVEKKYSKARALALKALALDPDSASAKMLLENAQQGIIQK